MKKVLIYSLCIAVIVCASVFGTLAYLTDQDSAVNTFTVGNVNITLDEAKVNTDGTAVEGADRVQENEYHMIPGRRYTKDPMITVAEKSEESYVRMLVTINEITALKSVLGDDFLPENYVTGWNSEVWECVKVGEVVDDTVTYEFRYFETVEGEDGELSPLFTSFTVPGELTGEELESIADLTIIVKGHAIQAEGFVNADVAWAAFDEQYKAATE